MTKTEIIQKLAEDCDTTQKLAGKILDAFTALVGEELAKGESVVIMGFGKFTMSTVKGRIGKNPQDPSQEMEIPDTNRVYFSAGQKLKDRVNEPLRKKAAKKAAKEAPAAKKGNKPAKKNKKK